jgi:hypothetical protein
VVLTDLDGKHMTSRALLKGQDAAAVARALLREAEEPKSFNHPIRYPKLGLAWAAVLGSVDQFDAAQVKIQLSRLA